MKIRRIIYLLVILILSGCMNSIRVYEETGSSDCRYKKLPGIPFYAKAGAYKQTTTYEVYLYQATLSTESADGKDKFSYLPILVGTGKYDDLVKLKQKVLAIKNAADGNKLVEDYAKLQEAWQVKPGEQSVPKDFFVDMVGNALEQAVIVDYKKKLYLNAVLPWFGSGSVNGELNADGTLSKASSTVSTGLAEALSSLLPIKEVLQNRLAPSTIQKAATEGTLKYSLSIEKVGNIFELSALYTDDPRGSNGCPLNAKCELSPIVFGDPRIENYKKIEFKTSAMGGKEETPSKNKIRISGDVVLPDNK